jgi:predicted O-linked N-acetylglucosamine transferase (SPINDLY family)
MLSPTLNLLEQQAEESLEQNNYAQALSCYEQLLSVEPQEIRHVLHFGLCQLLAGQETEAQLTWMMALSEAEPEQVEHWTEMLVNILQVAAEQQEAQEGWQMAWAIRQYLHEAAPTNIHNLLHLIQLAIQLDQFAGDYLNALQITELLQSQAYDALDEVLLLQTLDEALVAGYKEPQVLALTEASLEHIHDTELLLTTLRSRLIPLSNNPIHPHAKLECYLAEIYLRYRPADIEILRKLSLAYESLLRNTEAVETARKALAACQTPDQQMMQIGFLALRLLRTGFCWDEVEALLEKQKILMPELLQQYVPNIENLLPPTLLTFCSFYTYYVKDDPVMHRQLQNQLAEIVQTDVQFHAKKSPELYRQQFSNRSVSVKRKLKVGYIAHCMRRHSVGWLARWLMRYHDYDRFDIHTYHVHMRERLSFTDQWFIEPTTSSVLFSTNTWDEIATYICEKDKIDILVDLDSITYSDTCAIMALKSAPIQLSWLAYDASGLPSIDYFLADPYVLPESAQSYYREQIWRLPNTYVAVDGFEIGVPTLRRDRLGIPTDSIIYLTAQDARKRHPGMMRLQMKILQAVPQSHLLIKGFGDEASIQEAFRQMAEEEGVGGDRLHFLDRDDSEPTHRANLSIADVVLDTYPYNGATTTLETLWAGIPIVTRVGQQWAARNSYAFMTNVGISEGVAWTDEEYVEWGVRLGRDAALRQDVRMRLLQSRQTSPLWNTKQFAREMENAYGQMWQRYLESL